MRATNARLTAGAGRRVTVAANDRAEVRFPMSAEEAGTARFQFAAAASAHPSWADAAQLELPVWTPATTESFATYGTLDPDSLPHSVRPAKRLLLRGRGVAGAQRAADHRAAGKTKSSRMDHQRPRRLPS